MSDNGRTRAFTLADGSRLTALHDGVFEPGTEILVDLAGEEETAGLRRLPGPGAPPAADTSEERRLLFVGMTRARSRLLLSYAAPRGASPFLAAIDSALLSRTQVGKRPALDRQLRLL